jgi:chemotaxis protein methyltransferase CheR
MTVMENINSLRIKDRLASSEFQQLSGLIYDQCGINLVAEKQMMLESRLSRRLRTLGMQSFKDYIQYVTSQEGTEKELVHMIDVVTTNKTDFFREPHHFEYLRSVILPEFHQHHAGRMPFKVWSSACSSGEEPYTLAMVLQDFSARSTSFDYTILASDISTQVLQKATLAIYSEHQVDGLPLDVKQRYLMKSKDKENPTVRVIAKLREKVQFERINLMDTSLPVEMQDVIFCRNVLIYFDRETQLEVVQKLIQKIKPGGYLILGHSESLHAFHLPLRQIKPTIFMKK